MALHNVDIKGLNAVTSKLKALGADLPQIVDKSLETSAESLKRAVQEKTRTVTASYNGHVYKAYDTGQLARGIITRKTAQCQWQVAATAEHSIFVEFGTGSAGDPAVAHTARPKWVYFSELDGEYRTAYPQPARPYMRPAFAENKDRIVYQLRNDIVQAAISAYKGGNE